MDGNDVSSDQVIAELVGMGFDFPEIMKAIKAVGPSLDNAIEFILNDSRRESGSASNCSAHVTKNKILGKRATSSLETSCRMRQQNITEHLEFASGPQKSKTRFSSIMNNNLNHCPAMSMVPPNCKDEEEGSGFDWEKNVKNLLLKHFGFSSLKDFQKDVIATWLANQDCLVLAATGSGKSLCFQVPALLSGKVVVVISPLISLMHDQCLKLGKHGISSCFLGSGQIDKSVEKKAMSGAYDIIYVCPESVLRLIRPLQSLAESHGIALFAIDEVHCVSKWGHDFRPDYRKLSMLRENFSAEKLKFLKFDIPLMALTATATIPVRQDILKSLCMSTRTKIVTTSFFRPNLRFSVKHSRTSASSSYAEDFSELIELYSKNKNSLKNLFSQDSKSSSKSSNGTSSGTTFRLGGMYRTEVNNINDYDSSGEDELSGENGTGSLTEDGPASSDEKELSVQFLEDDYDQLQEVDDLDVSCGAFRGESPLYVNTNGTPDCQNLLIELKEKPGTTIVYVPTRKETLSVANFLSRSGVKAAAYNAKLPKSHLRQVHKEFHENKLQVVVATIAFGMGIDKSNVRRIIHYGWPQSLEAYYQEAGRAGRDGESADCVLYANLSRIPTLFPSKRSEEQTKQAYKMLSDCFRYGMNKSLCRAKMLVEYFGEEFTQERCLICDVCIIGPPEIQNLKAEANILLKLISTHYGQDGLCDDYGLNGLRHKILKEKPDIKAFVSRIMEQNLAFAATDHAWWRGLARILEDKGFIREEDDMKRVQIRFPEITDSGLQFLKSELEQPFHVNPEADMLLSTERPKPYSRFSEWKKGWADPEIRRQRLERKKTCRQPRKRKSRKNKSDLSTVRGRLSAKLSK